MEVRDTVRVAARHLAPPCPLHLGRGWPRIQAEQFRRLRRARRRRDPPGPLAVQQALGQRPQACLLGLDVTPLIVKRLLALG